MSIKNFSLNHSKKPLLANMQPEGLPIATMSICENTVPLKSNTTVKTDLKDTGKTNVILFISNQT